MKTQCERLLEYLEEHKKITPLESWQHLGIYRLSSRIHDLKNAGHKITKCMVKVKNQFQETCRVAEYTLEIESAQQ